MKFGFRIPSITKRIAARTSVKRIVRHNLGFKAPRGWGWLTNPKRGAYNRIYNQTSRGCMLSILYLMIIPLIIILFAIVGCSETDSPKRTSTYVSPSIDYKGKFRKGHVRKAVSTSKHAVKNQSRSRYYYQTRGKYRRKSNK